MSDDEDLISKQWPGFKVICRQCNGEKIVLEDTRGYSAESGGWGTLDLVCQSCGNSATVDEPF